MKATISPSAMRRVLNLWPPFLFAGVHVGAIAEDWRQAHVELRMRPWNRNYVGTHFGGSLFSMTDPFWMILTLKALGRDYIVWDQAGSIEFIKPGRGTVHARFALDDAILQDIRQQTSDGAKHLRWFETDVVDAAGEVVARVRKQIYMRRKRGRGSSAADAEIA